MGRFFCFDANRPFFLFLGKLLKNVLHGSLLYLGNYFVPYSAPIKVGQIVVKGLIICAWEKNYEFLAWFGPDHLGP